MDQLREEQKNYEVKVPNYLLNPRYTNSGLESTRASKSGNEFEGLSDANNQQKKNEMQTNITHLRQACEELESEVGRFDSEIVDIVAKDEEGNKNEMRK